MRLWPPFGGGSVLQLSYRAKILPLSGKGTKCTSGFKRTRDSGDSSNDPKALRKVNGWWPDMPTKPQKLRRTILLEVAKHRSGMREADLQSRLRYIFQVDDIPFDLALLGMEEDGIVLFQLDGSVSLTDLGYKLRRTTAKRSKS